MQQSDQIAEIPKIPVTVLTGFLGSGKTTLLNHILNEQHGHKIAVIVNEFGEVGIDDKLVVSSTEQVVTMNNGCICCTAVRGDLIKLLADLAQKHMLGEQTFERVVIETTGLADPAPVIQTFLGEAVIDALYQLDAVVTLVDAYHIREQLKSTKEAVEQIAFADVVLLNKTDLVTEDELREIEAIVVKVNPRMKIIRTERSKVVLDQIIDIHAFELETALSLHPELNERADDKHQHTSDVSSLVIRSQKPIKQVAFIYWVGNAIQRHAERLMRYKGIVSIEGMEKQLVFQGVHSIFEIHPGREWKDGEERKTEMVLIGKNLDHKLYQESYMKMVELGDEFLLL
jgi:G3E family GTPase